MYKIIALDLDDTLLNSKKEISLENKKALEACQARGIKIVIATGRPYNGITKILKELNLLGTDTYAICFNGGLIYNLKNLEIINKTTLKGRDIKEIYNEAKRLGVNYHVFDINQKLSTPKENTYTNYEAKINHINFEIIDPLTFNDNDAFIKGMMIDPEEKISMAINNLNDSIKAKYSYFRSAPFFLEFLNPKATKGNALLWLADYLGYSQKETMAFGDSENDISMIIEAGMGIAMENSYPHIKAKANYVTTSCDDDGVSKAIHKFILDI